MLQHATRRCGGRAGFRDSAVSKRSTTCPRTRRWVGWSPRDPCACARGYLSIYLSTPGRSPFTIRLLPRTSLRNIGCARARTDDGCRSGHPDRGHAHALDASAARQHACGARVGEAVAGVARAAAVPCACWLVRESLLGCPVRRSLHTAAGDTARAAPAELDAGPRAAHAREVDAHVVDAQPRAPLQVETRPARPGRRIGRGGPKLRAA